MTTSGLNRTFAKLITEHCLSDKQRRLPWNVWSVRFADFEAMAPVDASRRVIDDRERNSGEQSRLRAKGDV